MPTLSWIGKDKVLNHHNDVVSYKVTPIHAPGAGTHKTMVYAIQHPITGELMYPPKGRHWKDGQMKLLEIMKEWAPYELRVIDDSSTREKICGSSVTEDIPAIMLSLSVDESARIAKERYNTTPRPGYFFLSKGLGSIQSKTYLDTTKGKVVSTLWKYEDVGTNVEATNELKALLSDGLRFDTPKPTRLIERILQIASDKDSIILDSFAGSGTTAHAVLNANKADGGNRRFILVEMEDYADSITAERVKRVINGYGEGNKAVEGTGGGFSFYELGKKLFVDSENLNQDVPTEEIRKYIWFMETRSDYEAHTDEEPLFVKVVVSKTCNKFVAYISSCFPYCIWTGLSYQ